MRSAAFPSPKGAARSGHGSISGGVVQQLGRPGHDRRRISSHEPDSSSGNAFRPFGSSAHTSTNQTLDALSAIDERIGGYWTGSARLGGHHDVEIAVRFHSRDIKYPDQAVRDAARSLLHERKGCGSLAL